MENYEKKYKDALERAKKIVNDQNASSVWKGWLCNCFPELKESEDDRIRKCICLCLEECVHNDIIRDYEKDKCLAWLEKQGEQKPTDKEMKELLRTEYEKGRADTIAEMQGGQKPQRMISAEAKEALYGKPAWSKEDESRINDMCHFLNEYGDQYYGGLTLQGTISWLKSLRPQNRWKPSDEQMTALRRMKAAIAGEGEIYKPLNSLYEDLKKLREE